MIRFPLDILFVFTLFHGYSMANKLQVPYQHDPPNEQMLHESVPSVDEHSPWITGPQGKKYQFHIGKQSWLAAREKCLAQNSDLATITSTDELQWLLSRYKPQFPYTRERQVQIGLLLDQSGATAKDREWRWVSGQLLDPNMLRWTQGEPFDHAKGKERCALFNINEVRIDDVDCDLGAGRSYNYRFVCERTHQSHVEHESLNNPLWKKMEDILSYFGINSSGEKSNNPIPPTNQNHLNRILAEKEAVRKTKNNTGPDEQRKEETEKNTQELKPEPVEQKPQNGEDQKPDLGSPERKQQNIVPIKPEGEQKDKNPAAELHPEPVEQKKVVIHKPDLSEAGKDQNSIPIKPESDRKDQNLAVIKPEPVEGKRVADQRPQEGIDQHPAARKPEPVEEKRVAGQKPQEGIDQNSDMNTERKDQDSTLKPEVHVEQNPTPIKTELELEKDQKRTPEEKHSPEQEKTNNQKAEPEQKNPKKLSESEKANQKVIPESEHQSIPEGNGSKQTQQPEQKAQTTASEAEKTNQKLATKPEPSADGKTQHLESAPVIIEAIAPGAKNLASIESRIVEPIREQNPVDQANAKALLHGSDSFIAASLDNNRSAEIVETSGKEVEQLDQKNSAETTSKEVITVPIATKDPTDTVPNSAASEKAVPDTVATKDTVVVENPTKSDEEKKAEEKLELVDAEVKNSKAVNGPKPQLEIRDGDEFDQPKVPKQLVVSNGTEKISKGVQQQPTLVEQKPKDPNPVDPVIAVANTLERSLMGRDAAAASLVSNSTEQKPPPPPNNDATIGVVDAVPARIQHLERIIGMVQQMIGLGGAPPTLGSEAKKAEKGPITFGKKPEKPDEDSAEREEEKEKKEKEKKKGEEEKKEENRKEEQNKAEKGKEGIEEKKEKVEKEHVRKEEKEPVEEKEHVKKEESKPEKEHVRKEEKKPVEEKEHSRKEEKKPEEEKGMDKDHIKSEENNKLEERKVEAIKEEKRKDGEEKKAIESEEKAQIKDEKQEKVEEPKEKAKAVEKKSNTEKEHTEKEEKKEESNKEKATTEVIQEEKKSEEKKEHAGNEEKKLEEVKEQERKERKKEEEKKEDKKEVKKTEDSEEIKQEEKKKIDIEKEEKKIEKEEVKPEEKKKRKEDHKGEKEVTEVKQEEKKLEEEKKQEGKEEGKIEEKKEQTRKEEKQPEEEKEQGKKEEKKLEEKKHDRKEERKLEEEENKEGKEEKKLEERKEQTRKEQRKIINREEEEAKNIEGMMKEMLGFFGHGKRERAPSQEESAREAKKTNREEWKRRESEGQKVEVNRSIERGALASHEAVDQAFSTHEYTTTMMALEGDFEEAERETRTHPGINGGDLVKNIIVSDPPEDEEEEECEAEKSESEGKKGQKSESEDQKEEQNQKRKVGEQLEPLGAKTEGQKSSEKFEKAEAEDQNLIKPEPEIQKNTENADKSEQEEKRQQISEVENKKQESVADGQKQQKTKSKNQNKQKSEAGQQKIVVTSKGSEAEEKNNDIGNGKSESTNQKSSDKLEHQQKSDNEEKNVGIKKPSGSRIEKYGPRKHDENDIKMGIKTSSSVRAGHPTPMSHLRDGDEVPPPGPDPTYLPYSEMQQKSLIRDGDDEYPTEGKTFVAKNPKGIKSTPADDWVLYNYTTSAEKDDNQDNNGIVEKTSNSSSTSSSSSSDANSSPTTPPAEVVQRQREERARVDNVYKLFSTKESVYDLIRRVQQAEARRLVVRQSIPDGTTEIETKNGPINGK